MWIWQCCLYSNLWSIWCLRIRTYVWNLDHFKEQVGMVVHSCKPCAGEVDTDGSLPTQHSLLHKLRGNGAYTYTLSTLHCKKSSSLHLVPNYVSDRVIFKCWALNLVSEVSDLSPNTRWTASEDEYLRMNTWSWLLTSTYTCTYMCT